MTERAAQVEHSLHRWKMADALTLRLKQLSDASSAMSAQSGCGGVWEREREWSYNESHTQVYCRECGVVDLFFHSRAGSSVDRVKHLCFCVAANNRHVSFRESDLLQVCWQKCKFDKSTLNSSSCEKERARTFDRRKWGQVLQILLCAEAPESSAWWVERCSPDAQDVIAAAARITSSSKLAQICTRDSSSNSFT